MKKLIGIILVIVVILAVGFFVFNSKPAKPLLVAYEGVLPGADCAGLKTELTLYKDNTYFLRETYLATRDGDKTYTSSGKWQALKSGKHEIIQLNYDKPQDIYNFLQKDADHLEVVGKDLKQIDIPATMNLTLTKKK
ncbi:MAG: copper resistance protein NlpE [Candidatus Margulisbacteria bacterium]|nr:copper resistance protein NlpE [Candidatus Margulisiibacteriota bacterium]